MISRSSGSQLGVCLWSSLCFLAVMELKPAASAGSCWTEAPPPSLLPSASIFSGFLSVSSVALSAIWPVEELAAEASDAAGREREEEKKTRRKRRFPAVIWADCFIADLAPRLLLSMLKLVQHSLTVSRKSWFTDFSVSSERAGSRWRICVCFLLAAQQQLPQNKSVWTFISSSYSINQTSETKRFCWFTLWVRNTGTKQVRLQFCSKMFLMFKHKPAATGSPDRFWFSSSHCLH